MTDDLVGAGRLTYRPHEMMLLAMVLLAAGPSSPEELLGRAQSSFERFKYQEGLDVLAKVLVDPELDTEQRARAYMLIGVGRYSLADQPGARAAFREAFALSPSLTLPPLTSPKIGALFEQLRPPASRQPPPEPIKQPAPLTPAPTQPTVASPTPLSSETSPATSIANRPFAQRALPWLLVAGVGVLAAATGAGFGVAANQTAASAQRTRFASDVDLLNRRAQTWATTANVLFAVAGGAGVTGLLLMFVLP